MAVRATVAGQAYVAGLAPAAPPRANDEEVLAWARRHDLDCWDSIKVARDAFEDAQTFVPDRVQEGRKS